MPTVAEMKSEALVINRSDSRCGNCRKGASPHAEAHVDIVDYKSVPGGGCGVRWRYLTSDYTGAGIEQAARDMRPDLEWFDQWPSLSPTP